MTKSLLFVALFASATFSLPASAKLYKWVDDKGTTHYGEVIPPEYAGKDRAELNKSGRVVNTKESLSREERQAKKQADETAREEEDAALEARRHDKALLNTYSNTAEIDLARNRNLQQVDARILSAASQIKMVNESLLHMKNDAETRTKAGRKVPVSLQDDIEETQTRLNKLQQDLEKTKEEKTSLESRYDHEKARYKELTGK